MLRYRLLAIVFSLLTGTPLAYAQGSYPERPVKFIVPFATGGDSDMIAREVASKLSELHRYTVIVENKPGAGGLLGAEYMLQQPADGYSVMVISPSYLTSALTGKPSFDAVGAIQPVVQLTRVPGALTVGGNSRFKSMQQLMAGAKAAPGKVTYASAGVGSLSNLTGELLASVAGVTLTHIPYKGVGAVLTDVASGQVDFTLSGLGAVRSLAQAGKLRVLAVAWPTRLSEAPDVPTYAEVGLRAVNDEFWHGVVASKNVPSAVIAKLNSDINDVLRDPTVKAHLARDSAAPQGGSPEQFRQAISTEYQRWQKLVKAAGIKAE